MKTQRHYLIELVTSSVPPDRWKRMGWRDPMYVLTDPYFGVEHTIVEADTDAVEWVVFTWTPGMDRSTDHAVGKTFGTLDDALTHALTWEPR